MLFISGARDPIGAMGEGVKKVADSFRAAGLADIQVMLYPEARHELFNELNRQEVYGDLASWLYGHLP